MEPDVGRGKRIPPVDSEFCLAAVGDGGDIMDGYVVGKNHTGELEELVEMALCRKWHHNDSNILGLICVASVICHALKKRNQK